MTPAVDPTRVLRLLRALMDEVAVLEQEALTPRSHNGSRPHSSEAVGFRNVLVHAYARVDDALVVWRVGDLSDLTAFAQSVSAAVTEA